MNISKTKIYLAIFVVSIILIANCGKVDKDKKINKESYQEELETYAKTICNKMFSCMDK